VLSLSSWIVNVSSLAWLVVVLLFCFSVVTLSSSGVIVLCQPDDNEQQIHHVHRLVVMHSWQCGSWVV
jgi:hypothetical protein